MSEATIALTVMTGGLFLSFLGFFIWGIRSGQFKNIEEAKYQLFHNKNTTNVDDRKAESEEKGGGKQ